MRDGFKVIDADRHVLEPSDMFDRYLPERFRGVLTRRAVLWMGSRCQILTLGRVRTGR